SYKYSDLRTADANILSGFHPTCLSNGPAQAIKTDYSAPRERGERETHGYPYTEPDLHRTMNPPARACGLIFHLDVARAAVASGRFVGDKNINFLLQFQHHSIFHLLVFLQKTEKLRRDKERNFCVLPVRLPWEGNLIIFSRHEPKNRRKSGMKKQMKKNMILQRGEAVILLLFFPGTVSNPRPVSSTRRKRIDRVSPTPVVNRIRATMSIPIIDHDLRIYFDRCKLHSTKWDKSSPFVKAELNVGSSVAVSIVLEYVRIYAQMQSELRWKLAYNPKEILSIPLQRTFLCELNDTYSATSWLMFNAWRLFDNLQCLFL
ncbi:hypothetical protein ALC60_09622, partial [Trachymyrmex zeteki]